LRFELDIHGRPFRVGIQRLTLTISASLWTRDLN
jgi:hypothetical protein